MEGMPTRIYIYVWIFGKIIVIDLYKIESTDDRSNLENLNFKTPTCHPIITSMSASTTDDVVVGVDAPPLPPSSSGSDVILPLDDTTFEVPPRRRSSDEKAKRKSRKSSRLSTLSMESEGGWSDDDENSWDEDDQEDAELLFLDPIQEAAGGKTDEEEGGEEENGEEVKEGNGDEEEAEEDVDWSEEAGGGGKEIQIEEKEEKENMDWSEGGGEEGADAVDDADAEEWKSDTTLNADEMDAQDPKDNDDNNNNNDEEDDDLDDWNEEEEEPPSDNNDDDDDADDDDLQLEHTSNTGVLLGMEHTENTQRLEHIAMHNSFQQLETQFVVAKRAVSSDDEECDDDDEDMEEEEEEAPKQNKRKSNLGSFLQHEQEQNHPQPAAIRSENSAASTDSIVGNEDDLSDDRSGNHDASITASAAPSLLSHFIEEQNTQQHSRTSLKFDSNNMDVDSNDSINGSACLVNDVDDDNDDSDSDDNEATAAASITPSATPSAAPSLSKFMANDEKKRGSGKSLKLALLNNKNDEDESSTDGSINGSCPRNNHDNPPAASITPSAAPSLSTFIDTENKRRGSHSNIDFDPDSKDSSDNGNKEEEDSSNLAASDSNDNSVEQLAVIAPAAKKSMPVRALVPKPLPVKKPHHDLSMPLGLDPEDEDNEEDEAIQADQEEEDDAVEEEEDEDISQSFTSHDGDEYMKQYVVVSKTPSGQPVQPEEEEDYDEEDEEDLKEALERSEREFKSPAQLAEEEIREHALKLSQQEVEAPAAWEDEEQEYAADTSDAVDQEQTPNQSQQPSSTKLSVPCPPEEKRNTNTRKNANKYRPEKDKPRSSNDWEKLVSTWTNMEGLKQKQEEFKRQQIKKQQGPSMNMLAEEDEEEEDGSDDEHGPFDPQTEPTTATASTSNEAEAANLAPGNEGTKNHANNDNDVEPTTTNEKKGGGCLGEGIFPFCFLKKKRQEPETLDFVHWICFVLWVRKRKIVF